jgi:hypothetical protein
MPDGTQKTETLVAEEAEISAWSYFPSNIYTVELPGFLSAVQEVSEERLKIVNQDQELNDIYPVKMSDSYFDDPRIANFTQYTAQTAWNILKANGYAMDNLSTVFTEMWTQEHHKHSLMEQHTHGFGAHIVGFYFLEVPEHSSNIVFHDPRPSKVQINLPEENISLATPASQMVNFTPKPGLMIFSSAWLPHSFGRHASDKPLKFVHFNLAVQQNQPICCPPPAEVV